MAYTEKPILMVPLTKEVLAGANKLDDAQAVSDIDAAVAWAGKHKLADYRPSYRKDTAADGWKRMLAWFKSHGVA